MFYYSSNTIPRFGFTRVIKDGVSSVFEKETLCQQQKHNILGRNVSAFILMNLIVPLFWVIAYQI